MKNIILFLFFALPILGCAQYPTTGNKQRLGWQTTGDGLVYRDAGYPSYTPNSRNNAYVYMDTVAKRYYHFSNGAWYDLSDEKYIHRQDQSVLALAVRDSLTTYDRLFVAMEITSAGASDRGVQLPVTGLDTSYAGRVVRVSSLDSSGTYNAFVASSSPDGLLVDGALATTYYLAADETVEFQLYVFDTIYQWRLVHTNNIEAFPIAPDSGYHVRSNALNEPEWYQITPAAVGDTIVIWNPLTLRLEYRTKTSLLSGYISGSLTTNTFPIATGTSTLGNSSLTFDASNRYLFGGTGAIQLPNRTTLQRSVSPLPGETAWNTTTGLSEIYNGSAWTQASFPTGTSAQTLRHDGSNWVASSLIQNNGTVTGIGTTNASYLFTLNRASAPGNDMMYFSGSGIDQAYILFMPGSTQGWRVGKNASGNFIIQNSVTTARTFAYTGTGLVGINNVSPSANLDITQAINGQNGILIKRATDTSPTGNFIILHSATGGNIGSIDINANMGLGVAASSSYRLQLNNSGVTPTAMRLLNSQGEISTTVNASGLSIIAATKGLSLTSGASANITLTPSGLVDIIGALQVSSRTGTATSVGGWDSSNKAVNVTLGSGLSLSGGTLSATGSYSGWTLAGDTGTPQSIGSGETANIKGEFGIKTETVNPDTLKINADTLEVVSHEQLQRSIDTLNCPKDLDLINVIPDTVFNDIMVEAYEEVGYDLDSIVLVGTGAIFLGADYNADPDCNYLDVYGDLLTLGGNFDCEDAYFDFDCDEVDGYLDFAVCFPNTGVEVYEVYSDGGELDGVYSWEEFTEILDAYIYVSDGVTELITTHTDKVILTGDTLSIIADGNYNFSLVYFCGDTVDYVANFGILHKIGNHVDNAYLYISNSRGNDETGRIDDINYPYKTLAAAVSDATTSTAIYFLNDGVNGSTTYSETSVTLGDKNPLRYIVPEGVQVDFGQVNFSTGNDNKTIIIEGGGSASVSSVSLFKNSTLKIRTKTLASVGGFTAGNGLLEMDAIDASLSSITNTNNDSSGVTLVIKAVNFTKSGTWYSRLGGTAASTFTGFVYADKIVQTGEAFSTDRAVSNYNLFIQCNLYEIVSSSWYFLGYFDNPGFTNSKVHIKAKKFVNAAPLINEFFRPGSGQSGQFVFEVEDYQYTGTQSLIFRTTGFDARDGSNADGSPMYVFRGNFTSSTTPILSRGNAVTESMLFEGTFKVAADSVKAFVWTNSSMTDNSIRFNNATIINTNANALDKTAGTAAKIRVQNSIIQNSTAVNNLVETFSSFYRPSLGGVTTMIQKTSLTGSEKIMLINEDNYVTVADISGGGSFFTQTASATISNTVTETTLTSAGVGTLTIPADYFQVGQTYVVRARGFFSTNSTPNLTLDIEVGGVDVVTSSAFAVQDLGGLNETWELQFEFTVRTTGASGTAIGQGDFKYCPVHINCRTVDLLNTSTFTLDTTASNAINVTAEWGTASTDNSITCTNLIIEVKN